MTFQTPPENQGQAVEVSYACGEGHVICRTHDRCDGEVSYMASKYLADDEGNYHQGAPLNRRWKSVKEEDLYLYDTHNQDD